MGPNQKRVTQHWSLLLVAVAVLVGLTIAASAFATRHETPPETGLSASEQRSLSNAAQHLIRGCMRSEGWTYWPISEEQINKRPRFPYVITDRAWASRYGFDAPPPQADPNESYVGALSTGQRTAYADALVGKAGDPGVSATLADGSVLGHSATGCQARAAAELYGNYQHWFAASSVVQQLPHLREQMVINDPQFRAKTHAWSACMATRGFAFSSPGSAAAAFRRTTAAPSSAEVGTAVAEVDCAASSGLAELVDRLDQSYGKEVDHTYRATLDTYWRMERAALPLALHILATQSPSVP